MGFECFGKDSGQLSNEIANSILDRTITELVSDEITYVGNYALSNCSNLTTVKLPNLSSTGQYSFQQCSRLAEVYVPKLGAVGYSAFYSCRGLKKIKIDVVTNFNTISMRNSGIETLILTNENEISTSSNINAFTDTPIASGTGYIYVPATLIEEYKTATNWVTYAEQFRAIEDYPDICGGE